MYSTCCLPPLPRAPHGHRPSRDLLTMTDRDADSRSRRRAYETNAKCHHPFGTIHGIQYEIALYYYSIFNIQYSVLVVVVVVQGVGRVQSGIHLERTYCKAVVQ